MNWLVGLDGCDVPVAYPLDTISSMYSVDHGELTVEFRGDVERFETLNMVSIVSATDILPTMSAIRKKAKGNR